MRAGVSKSTVTHWLNGKNLALPQVSNLIELAMSSGVGLDWLLLGEGPEVRGAAWGVGQLGTEFRKFVRFELLANSALDDAVVARLSELLARDDAELLASATLAATDDAHVRLAKEWRAAGAERVRALLAHARASLNMNAPKNPAGRGEK